VGPFDKSLPIGGGLRLSSMEHRFEGQHDRSGMFEWRQHLSKKVVCLGSADLVNVIQQLRLGLRFGRTQAW